jgi:hypothetical protein
MARGTHQLAMKVTPRRVLAPCGPDAAVATRATSDLPSGTESYSIKSLCVLFGTHRARVNRWVRCGLLGNAQTQMLSGSDLRFTKNSVKRFIRSYPREYDLRKVDRRWFASMVFGRRAPSWASRLEGK